MSEPETDSAPATERAPEIDTAHADRREFVRVLFQRVLRRLATGVEIEHWANVVAHEGHAAVVARLFESGEYLFQNRVNMQSEFRPGHFYSPVVDPEELRACGFHVDRDLPEHRLDGIELKPEAMEAFFRKHARLMNEYPFALEPSPGARYHARNDAYSTGDAAVLLAVMAHARPRRIVEVGSGFSSAHMLDVADRLRLETRFTFVEPYPERLHSLMSEADHERCTVVCTGVQQADPALFAALEANDILFVDSTHVSKAGSDVNHELFEILPRLRAGVIVHFHDTFYPFEYPDAWIFEARRSWNELYILRAYLARNQEYEIVFFNDYFRIKRPEAAAAVPAFTVNPGGALWLRKVGAPQPGR
jgi:predicted O-methyltransferase YrrM